MFIEPKTISLVENLILDFFKNQALHERSPIFACCIKSLLDHLNFKENDFNILVFERALKKLRRKKIIKIHKRKSKYRTRTYKISTNIYENYRSQYHENEKNRGAVIAP